MRLVMIGGSDAGISAALRARELDPSAEVSGVVSDAYPNFSWWACGLTPAWRLAHGAGLNPHELRSLGTRRPGDLVQHRAP